MSTTSKAVKFAGTVGTAHRRAIRLNGALRKVLADHSSKDYVDLRDRAAFVHITGTLPTHLRTHMTSLLRSMTVVRNEPTSLDGEHGSMKIEPHIARSMRLDNHPMVAKAKEFLSEGYKVQGSRDLKARRPFSRVFLYRDAPNGQYKMTVHSNGAIQEGWDGIDA
jgi:hypothetical protein